MKMKYKKLWISGIALALAGMLAAGALFQSSVLVEASWEMMPGIEQIVETTSKNEPFRILEIVDSLDEAEIGYYVAGQEPYLKLYKYTDGNGEVWTFSSLEEGLSKLPQAQRQEFASNKKTDEQGNISSTGKNIESVCGDQADAFPLSYSEYTEQYFVDDEDGWTRVDFVDKEGNPRTDIVQMNGDYQENTSGTGDYTRQEQVYYPIRNDVSEDRDKTDIYRENIEYFYYSDGEEAQAPYMLVFKEVENEKVNQALRDTSGQGMDSILAEYDHANGKYGYYENVYTELTEEIAVDIENGNAQFPGENPDVPENAVLLAEDIPQGKEAFSAGSEEEFQTVDEPVSEDITTEAAFGSGTEERFSAEDTFSSGDIEVSDEKIETPAEAEDIQAATDTVSEQKDRVILLGFQNEETKGSAQNPYIYLGESIAAYPYYKYTLVADLEKVKAIAQENWMQDAEQIAAGNVIVRREKDITLEDGQYWYWKDLDGKIEKFPLLVVTGRQEVEYSHVKALDESLTENYYHTVEKVYFCCRSSVEEPQSFADYQYYGWYYAAYPQKESPYLKVVQGDGKIATHYTSDAEYKQTPGSGNYDFVVDENSSLQTVEIDHMYYRGGYENHDWMKRFVFHLDPDEEEFEQFSIHVETLTAQEFELRYLSEDTTEMAFTDGSEEGAESAFSAGEHLDTDPLNVYDLIYINARVASVPAGSLVSAVSQTDAIPCIINTAKLTAGSGGESELAQAFAAFCKEEDADGHYVDQNIYFFKNTFDENDPFGLIHPAFDRNFNLAAEEGFYDTEDGTEGFEEILEYIEKENQYRQLTENGSEFSAQMLSTKISQARALEYIINYKWKRSFVNKEQIQVLELQPARSDGQITENMIWNWMGYPVSADVSVTACCEEANGNDGPASNMTDGKETTYWHSKYSGGSGHSGNHSITITYTQPVKFEGISYLPRQTGTNGTIEQFTLTCYDPQGNILDTRKGCTWSDGEENYKNYLLKDAVSNVSKVVIEITQSVGGFGSCAELRTITQETTDISTNPEIEITTMTTSEFVGHIEDINTKYDMIYIGDDESDLNYDANFRPNEKILYYHIGGSKLALYELQGLMDQDYVVQQDGSKIAAKIGKTDANTQTTVGSVRGSGNDITENIKEKLVDFVKSGYPVIAAGDIYGEGKREVSTELVDNSSYMYEFLNAVRSYSNVYREMDITNQKDIDFYANLPKPKIEFVGENAFPPSAIGDGNGPSGHYLTGENMTFCFQIVDEAQASPANAEYDCELYIDLNCDGNYSASEKMTDIVVSENGKRINPDQSGTYHLSLKTEYTVSRKIPLEYVKLMPWKLVVTNNANKEIRALEIGYTKRAHTGSQQSNTIRVLQIQPNSNCTWDLTDESFTDLFGAVDQDFHVQIDTTTVAAYEQQYKNDLTYLEKYHMLIIGFCDGGAYSGYGTNAGNFSEDGVQGILNFADTGKSVILAHDNTSSSNYNRDAKEVKEGNDTAGGGIWKGWAYYLNQKLRAVSGMDRYGITASETTDILKQARDLKNTDSLWNIVFEQANDMAFALNSEQKQTYAQTQGFTNGKLRIAVQDRTSSSTQTTTTASQVNEGAISEYPYKIDDTITVADTHFQYYQLAMEEDSDRDGSGDVVVWYCLGNSNNTSGSSYYDHTPNDVRNNYYIYSYKNIIYTGVGHSNVNGNRNNLMEKKLFVNTIIAAYNAQAVNPELSFIKQSDWNAADEKIVYYTLDNVNYSRSAELVKDSQEFHLKVTDSNLVGTSFSGVNTKDLKLELYVESQTGESVPGIGGENTKLEKIDALVYLSGEKEPLETQDGNIYVYSGNVYDFTLYDLQRYVLDDNGQYQGKVRLYAKISCQYIYYGVQKEAQSVAQIDICQRQLFDLD